MHRSIFISCLVSFIVAHTAIAQYDGLTPLKKNSLQVFFSLGQDHRAASISERVEKAITYFQVLLELKPTVTLLVLTEQDWPKFTRFPVYGMPHYSDNQTLIVAAEDNPLWKSFMPALDKLPAALREQVQSVYKTRDGNISMQPFFDLLALHELGHAFHNQGQLKMQRKWMAELYVNILLHTFIAENEPGSLPALTLLPQMVVSGSSREYKYTTLQELEERYEEIAKLYPKNYGWFQFRWHAGAAGIYDSEGKKVCKKLWDAFKSKKEKADDDEMNLLLENASNAVATFIRDWDKNTVR